MEKYFGKSLGTLTLFEHGQAARRTTGPGPVEPVEVENYLDIRELYRGGGAFQLWPGQWILVIY